MNSNFVWLNWHYNPVLVWPRLHEKVASMKMLFSNGSDSGKTKGVKPRRSELKSTSHHKRRALTGFYLVTTYKENHQKIPVLLRPKGAEQSCFNA